MASLLCMEYRDLSVLQQDDISQNNTVAITVIFGSLCLGAPYSLYIHPLQEVDMPDLAYQNICQPNLYLVVMCYTHLSVPTNVHLIKEVMFVPHLLCLLHLYLCYHFLKLSLCNKIVHL